MASLILLFIFEFFIFTLFYKYSGYDLISPANFSLLTFFIATFFAIIGAYTWDIDFSVLAMLYLSIGITMMLLGQQMAKTVTRRFCYVADTESLENRNLSRININISKVIFVDMIVVALTALYVYDILRAGNALGAKGLAAIATVKYANNAGTSSIIRQGIKIVMAASFVDCFIVARNFVAGWKRKDFFHIISLCCAGICSLFTSVRTEILRIIFAVFVLYFLNVKEKRGWNKEISSKILSKFLPILVIFALVFTSMKTVVKTSDLPINEAFTTFQYIAYYIGSPILVFGIKESNGFNLYHRNLFGELTFNAFWENLAEMGIISSDYLSVTSTNVYISREDSVTANVDTIFGGLMIDFGIYGMAVFIFLLYFFLSIYYYKKVKYKKVLENKFAFMTYSFLFYLPGMAYYANVFGQYIATYFILTYIIMYLIYVFYFRVTIRRGFKIVITTDR